MFIETSAKAQRPTSPPHRRVAPRPLTSLPPSPTHSLPFGSQERTKSVPSAHLSDTSAPLPRPLQDNSNIKLLFRRLATAQEGVPSTPSPARLPHPSCCRPLGPAVARGGSPATRPGSRQLDAAAGAATRDAGRGRRRGRVQLLLTGGERPTAPVRRRLRPLRRSGVLAQRGGWEGRGIALSFGFASRDACVIAVNGPRVTRRLAS